MNSKGILILYISLINMHRWVVECRSWSCNCTSSSDRGWPKCFWCLHH